MNEPRPERIIGAPLHLRLNTITEDEEVACDIRLVEGHFDKVQFHLKSRHDCPMPLDNPIFQYALANVPDGVGIIVQRDVWPSWSDRGNAGSPMLAEWYMATIREAKMLAGEIDADSDAEHALNAEPQGRSPQLWLRDNWDESKRAAIEAAIHASLMEVGPVHYIAPSTTLGEGKSRFASSMQELGITGIDRQTYRKIPGELRDTGTWNWEWEGLRPDYWYDVTHPAKLHIRGLWVTAAKDGMCVGRDGKERRVLTVEQALSCPEASYWNVNYREFQAVLEQVAGR